MIKVSVLYPNADDINFDIDYYCNKHVPMVIAALGDALKAGAVDYGIAGGIPGAKAPFIAMTHLTFESVEAFQGAFGPKAGELLADIPNFTNSQPQIQISEIKI